MPDDNIRFVEDNNIQWVEDNLQQWGLLLGYDLSQIWTDETYVYAVTISGLDIVDISAEKKIAFIPYETFSTVWANDEKVYLGTTVNGIKCIDKTCISGSITNWEDLSMCLSGFATYSGISSNVINYIHGNNDWLMCCTDVGVDILNTKEWYRSYTTVEGAKKCFMSSSGRNYYTVYSEELFLKNKWGITEPLLGENLVLSNKRLTTTKNNTTWGYGSVKTKYTVSDGKWYWEFTSSNITDGAIVGIATEDADVDLRCGINEHSWGYHTSGSKQHDGTGQIYGSPWSSSNTVGVALDMNDRKLWFSLDGVWQNSGVPVSGTGEAYSSISGTVYAMLSHYYDGQVGIMNFGDTPFNYTPPTGFNAGFGMRIRNAWSVNVVGDHLWDWDTPDYSITTKADIFPYGTKINDIFVTEHTASNQIDNTLFVATSSGTYMIDETDMETLSYAIYSIVDSSQGNNVHHILLGDNPNYTAVWADYNNKLYVANLENLFIVNLTTNTLHDHYTTTHSGGAGEVLEHNDIVDINITGAG